MNLIRSGHETKILCANSWKFNFSRTRTKWYYAFLSCCISWIIFYFV